MKWTHCGLWVVSKLIEFHLAKFMFRIMKRNRIQANDDSRVYGRRCDEMCVSIQIDCVAMKSNRLQCTVTTFNSISHYIYLECNMSADPFWNYMCKNMRLRCSQMPLHGIVRSTCTFANSMIENVSCLCGHSNFAAGFVWKITHFLRFLQMTPLELIVFFFCFTLAKHFGNKAPSWLELDLLWFNQKSNIIDRIETFKSNNKSEHWLVYAFRLAQFVCACVLLSKFVSLLVTCFFLSL